MAWGWALLNFGAPTLILVAYTLWLEGKGPPGPGQGGPCC
jgi:hypothetical protein